MHAWEFSPPLEVHRPDGTIYEALWLLACSDCADACHGDPTQIEAAEEGVYIDEHAAPPN